MTKRDQQEGDEHMLLSTRASATDKAATLRQLIATKTIALPGAFNAPVAMLSQQLGFEAVYISGAGLINSTTGYPDIGLLGMEEVVRQAGYIASAIDVPAICDADTGFGDALQVIRTVQAFETAGVAGIHLEDQQMPKRCGHLDGKTVVPVAEMERKIAAAVEARRNPDFLLIAPHRRQECRGIRQRRRARAEIPAGGRGRPLSGSARVRGGSSLASPSASRRRCWPT